MRAAPSAPAFASMNAVAASPETPKKAAHVGGRAARERRDRNAVAAYQAVTALTVIVARGNMPNGGSTPSRTKRSFFR